MQIRVHTKGITGSSVIKDAEEAGAMFAGVFEVDGHVLEMVTSINVSSGEDFTTVKVTFIPGDIEYITHSEESWEALMETAEQQRRSYSYIRLSDGRTIARQAG
jgi:hypothetical protein